MATQPTDLRDSMLENLEQSLIRFDTCILSDAMDRLGLAGATIGVRPAWKCPKIFGRAVTMKLKPAGIDRPKQHLGTAAIELARPGEIIVIENRVRADAPGWGGLLSLAAKTKGIAGVVTDGPCRDVDECEMLSFPVYANSVVPISARGRIVQESVNKEIQFAGVQVRPNDLIVADGSGVIVIPQEKVAEVIAAATDLADREAEMADEIRAGKSILEVLERRGYEALTRRKDQ
jgi:4-hydroxy-4-methyl-2-oxoglutarate aldolase